MHIPRHAAAQIDLEEYDESGDARKRWRDAMDAAGTTMGQWVDEGAKMIHINLTFFETTFCQ